MRFNGNEVFYVVYAGILTVMFYAIFGSTVLALIPLIIIIVFNIKETVRRRKIKERLVKTGLEDMKEIYMVRINLDEIRNKAIGDKELRDGQECKREGV